MAEPGLILVTGAGGESAVSAASLWRCCASAAGQYERWPTTTATEPMPFVRSAPTLSSVT